MAPSNILFLIIVNSLVSFGSTLSVPASLSDSSLTLSTNAQGNYSSSNGWTTFWISADGSQIVPIDGPQEVPSNLTAANEDSTTISFGKPYGPATPRPGLASFLFECEFALIDQIPWSSAQGKWLPYPGGKYACTTRSPGKLSMEVNDNPFGWKMAYRDIGLLLKTIYYAQALQSSTQCFKFVVNYTNDLSRHRIRTVASGEWQNTNENAEGTSSQ